MNDKTHRWTRPEVIAIVRGRPEESVLSLCKGDVAGSPNAFVSYCSSQAETEAACEFCSEYSES